MWGCLALDGTVLHGPREAPKARFFGHFRLDLGGSRRYIRHTLRQAVSFACSERPARQGFEKSSFSRNQNRRNASTNEAQTLPLTADVRVLSEGKGADGMVRASSPSERESARR